MPLQKSHGILSSPEQTHAYWHQVENYVRLKFTAAGGKLPDSTDDEEGFAESFIRQQGRQARRATADLPAVDQRIQDFLQSYFKDTSVGQELKLPNQTFTFDRHGIARTVSLPHGKDSYKNEIIESYRLQQGILHNPVNDRRTTKGVFHVTENGLPIATDKKSVPLEAAARIFQAALNPPTKWMGLPFAESLDQPFNTWVSLLLRPLVVPAVQGFTAERRMEVRFFAPGSMACNLDFVESIFGNAGDPALSENDSALDPEHWTGTTGAVILAPHLTLLKKKDLGLPHIDKATERQKRDGMCWSDPEERYNDGGAFKITCRDGSGRVVTAIADNYFGYCKKEVKTQISFSANIIGQAEEEHAGGAWVFPSYDLGEDFQMSEKYLTGQTVSLEENARLHPDAIEMQPDGYGIDKNFPGIYYVAVDTRISLEDLSVRWIKSGEEKMLRLQPGVTYVYPTGYSVDMIKPAEGRRWRLRGVRAEGLFCHKPCTVSGGGKSEISKPISDAILSGPVFVKDFESDFNQVKEILNYNYGNRFKEGSRNRANYRKLLSPERSLGSVIKLLTPSPEYTGDYNQWLSKIPDHVKELVLIIKRFYKSDWTEDWLDRFSVDWINNLPGNELRYRKNKLLTQYLRVGFRQGGNWRTFGLRKDFLPAVKMSLEDDISGSVVVPASALGQPVDQEERPSYKFIQNCESRFFQRPDDAIIRGYDKQTEIDFSGPGNFFSNYAPLTREEVLKQSEDIIRFEQYTEPMQDLLTEFLTHPKAEFCGSTANPRIVNGKPTANPRYLQIRPDLTNQRDTYLAMLRHRLLFKFAEGKQVLYSVGAVLPGRRNNPKESGIRPLCPYSPVHYMELPELFMEYIASLTGKSPSTTGAGSEGALTKGPFNALLPIHDLNAALLSHLLTGYEGFVTAAGWVGPHYRVDHDVSLLVPEVWSRMRPHERKPEFLLENGFLEKVPDMTLNGQSVLSSRLGYRITDAFVRHFFGRIFNDPNAVFDELMLQPEKQDADTFVDGVNNIVEAHERVAKSYFEDGSIDLALPPLKALLNIMAYGSYEGLTLQDKAFRDLFNRDNITKADWYLKRLEVQKIFDIGYWTKAVADLEKAITSEKLEERQRPVMEERLKTSQAALAKCESADYVKSLVGSIGRDNF